MKKKTSANIFYVSIPQNPFTIHSQQISFAGTRIPQVFSFLNPVNTPPETKSGCGPAASGL